MNITGPFFLKYHSQPAQIRQAAIKTIRIKPDLIKDSPVSDGFHKKKMAQKASRIVKEGMKKRNVNFFIVLSQ
jgi:hypothetical protein